MKTKKENPKKESAIKTKTAAKKKVAARISTVSAVKKVVKKTKTATAPKRAVKKVKTIAATKLTHKKESLLNKFLKLGRKEIRVDIKRVTYVLLSLVVGILTAGFVVGFLEMVYLKNSLNSGVIPISHQFFGMNLFLFPVIYIFVFGAGLVFGTWLGFWGWRMVYIERRHRMYRNK